MADDNSPAFLPGAFQAALAAIRPKEQLTERFKTGEGMGWHEHHAELFVGTERFFRPGYAANLIAAWIPSLEGVDAKLKSGARVADVGCGLGASTILMAKSYPKSSLPDSITTTSRSRPPSKRAKDAGVGDRIRFEVARAKTYPGKDYDFVTFFDCLHDMGDPAGASAHVHSRLEERRHVDDRRALCRRQAGGQSQSHRPRVLRSFHASVHAGVAVAGSGAGAWRAGRREAPARSGDERRLYAIPPRHADAIQSGVRGAAVAAERAAIQRHASNLFVVVAVVLDDGYFVRDLHTVSADSRDNRAARFDRQHFRREHARHRRAENTLRRAPQRARWHRQPAWCNGPAGGSGKASGTARRCGSERCRSSFAPRLTPRTSTAAAKPGILQHALADQLGDHSWR